MLETNDPRKQLTASDLATQTAAARDLARMGDWSDMAVLLELATTHRRTGLRLGAAAAAADIVHRYRTGTAGDPLTSEQTTYLMDWVKGMDPATNPGALMVLASIADKTAIARLGRLLRDPRSDVRQAAALAVRRMALSHCDLEASALRQAVRTWFAHRKLTPDARGELARLVGDAGWFDLRTQVLDSVSVGGAAADLCTTALERLEARANVESWHGLWVTDGLDVLEQSVEPRGAGWMLVGTQGVALQTGRGAAWSLVDNQLQSKAVAGPARMIWASQVGTPVPRPALQIDGRTWYRAPTDSLVTWVDKHHATIGARHKNSVDGLVRALEAEEGAASVRARAIAWICAGKGQNGLDLLQAPMSGGKVRHDLHYWAGRAYETLDDTAAAHAAFEQFMTKPGKVKAWVDYATKALGGS